MRFSYSSLVASFSFAPLDTNVDPGVAGFEIKSRISPHHQPTTRLSQNHHKIERETEREREKKRQRENRERRNTSYSVWMVTILFVLLPLVSTTPVARAFHIVPHPKQQQQQQQQQQHYSPMSFLLGTKLP
jgi:hypothetical protein